MVRSYELWRGVLLHQVVGHERQDRIELSCTVRTGWHALKINATVAKTNPILSERVVPAFFRSVLTRYLTKFATLQHA